MIRDATPDDRDALAVMGNLFFIEAGLGQRFGGDTLEYDPASFVAACGVLLERGALMVAEKDGAVVGMIGCMFVPAYWNVKVLLAQEVFWWVHPDHRKGVGSALLKEVEARAAMRGVHLCAMVAETGLRGDAVGRLYKAKGYAPAETVFWKRLGGTWQSDRSLAA